MKRHFLIPAIAAVALCAMIQAKAGEIAVPQCPAKLDIQQIVKSQVTDGWKTVNDEQALPAIGIAITTGEYPVKQTGFDIPSQEIKRPNGDMIIYFDYLTPLKGGLHDYWMVCRYINSEVVLVQKIPENVRRCEIKYLNDPLAPDQITIRCFDTPREARK